MRSSITRDKGRRLMDQVIAYYSFGHHRTGTEVDRQTALWFAARLREIGALVSAQCYSLSRFDGHASLQTNGSSLVALTLCSSWAGDLASDRIRVIGLDVDVWDDTQQWQGAVATACASVRIDGLDALVIATKSASGELVALNCSSLPQFDIPVVLVSGRDLQRLKHKAELMFSARRVASQSCNIIGRLDGSTAAGRIVITTPLTGWFGCAGERGTGIAILLELIRELVGKRPITVIGTTGHELGHLGGELAAASYSGKISHVIHLGSCLASSAQTNGRSVPRFRTILQADARTTVRISQLLQARGLYCLGVGSSQDPNSWQGESRLWASKTKAMISIASVSDVFHTELDCPELSTSPKLLEDTFNLIRDIMFQFI
jgi:hypothetical protein